MQDLLESSLIKHIRTHGPIPFDQFMEASLYHPEWGYYESGPSRIGRLGDFQTSVTVGPLFGNLLAEQFLEWSGDQVPAQWLECGAHHGQLAEDILQNLRQRENQRIPEIKYLILEPSEKRRQHQQKRLAPYGDSVAWVPSWKEARQQFNQGVIFSNELLDAFPVKRYAWNKQAASWVEYCVDHDGSAFRWIQQAPKTPFHIPWLSSEALGQLEAFLPDQYVVEWSPKAEDWWKDASETLEAGYLMTIDYGFVETDRLAAHRTQGSLRAYHAHRSSNALLEHVGQQDITAHVDFPSLRHVGEASGLCTLDLVSQESFLHRCFEQALQKGMKPSTEQLRQLQTLIHPEHFGRAFKALIQKRGL